MLSPPQTDYLTDALDDVRTRNAKIIGEFRKALYKSGTSPKMVEQHIGSIQSFTDHYLLAQDPPRPLLEMRTQDVDRYLNSLSQEDAIGALKSFKRYARFLWDSARSNPDALDLLRTFLKSYQPKRD